MRKWFILPCICLSSFACFSQSRDKSPDGILPNEAMGMLRVIANTSIPFLESDEAKHVPVSLDHFFGHQEYSVLHGNPVLGYCSRQGLKWDGKRIAISVTSMGKDAGSLAITPKAWALAFKIAAKAHKVILDDSAPVKVEGACVLAILRPGDDAPRAGVVLELRATDSNGGLFLFRFNQGKDAGIQAAILGAADYIFAVLHEAGK